MRGSESEDEREKERKDERENERKGEETRDENLWVSLCDGQSLFWEIVGIENMKNIALTQFSVYYCDIQDYFLFTIVTHK